MKKLINKVIPVKGKFVKETRGYREADVQELLRMICGKLIVKQGATDYVLYGNKLVKYIESESGFVLTGEKN